MQEGIQRRFLRGVEYALFSATAFVAIPVCAQEGQWPSNAQTHPGEIVYSREVPYGTATRRFVQGEERTVTLDQTPLINHSLLIGMEPLSDAEQAAVSAPLIRSLSTGQTAIDAGLAALSAKGAASDFTRSESGSNGAGGIVNQSLSVIPGALSAISRTVGNGQ